MPPGEIQEVQIEVTSGRLVAEGTLDETALTWGPLGGATPSGTLHFVATDVKPVIKTMTPTGFQATIDAGGEGTQLHLDGGGYRLDTGGFETAYVKEPKRFPYSWDELVVRYAEHATSEEVAMFEASIGAEVVYVSPWRDYHILRFTGTEWWGITSKLIFLRHTPLVSLATLNPVMESTSASHDAGLWDDPGFQDDGAAFMADAGVEAAWSTTTGSRDVVIGIVDEGFDINHPDLVNNLWINAGELPGDVCGVAFLDLFDLDGDGVFTLNDLNNPTSSILLSSALSELSSCEGITLNAGLFDAAEDYDNGLFQGSDLELAFADGVDGYGGVTDNGYVDDLFGVNFSSSELDGDCAEAQGDVYPQDSADSFQNEVHGTLTSGLMGASQGNKRNIAGVMGEVRIAMVRINTGCGLGFGTNGGLGEFYDGIEYLSNSVGADIVVIAKGLVQEDSEDYVAAYVKNLTSDFEQYPDVLFVTSAGNGADNCDDAEVFCWPAGNTAANVLRVVGTGVDWEAGDMETMSGEWEETTHPTTGREYGTSYGEQTFNISAPGFLYWTWDGEEKIDYDFGMNLLKAGTESSSYNCWKPASHTPSGGASLAVAFVGGVAGLTKAACPTLSGQDLVLQILNAAETSPPVSVRVENGRYIDADGAVACSP